MKNLLKDWKYPLLLLSGVGIANLGAWIYLIALNVLVYHMGGSALAVATLYVIKPLAALFTNVSLFYLYFHHFGLFMYSYSLSVWPMQFMSQLL